MPVATTRTVSLQGMSGHVIDVQADVSTGVVATSLVGRLDASINEARDRCRAALTNSGFDWPATKRVTVLLSPADLPKSGPHFDLAIAVAVLAANGVVPTTSLPGLVLAGELSLDGRVRAVPGVLPMVLAARDRGLRHVIVPDAQVDEASLVPGVTVTGVRSLGQVVAMLREEELPEAPVVEPRQAGQVLRWRGEDRADDLDLADVHGMADARFALEVAAAGGHHLMLTGPKGAGKTTLAERLPGLLPDLTLEQSLELCAIHSLAGDLVPSLGRAVRPPFRAPHHSATKASMLGGGTGRVHPGEISRALHGVLFLDEFPLFTLDIIDALRQPLESGEVTIARGDQVATFPARSLVVLASNPCPCGDYHPDARVSRCSCSEVRRRQYRARVSAPVDDRIDIKRHVLPVQPYEVHDPLGTPEPSATVRARVEAARARQAERYESTPWRINADVPGPRLSDRWPLTPEATGLLEGKVLDGVLTRRGSVRVRRLAWTLADLSGVSEHGSPGVAEVDTAVRLRLGTALPVSVLPGAAR
jgi:magnesium chelatase family protein